MANETKNEGFRSPRVVIALTVSSLVLIGIIIFGTMTIANADDTGEAAKDVLTFTLPVFGTWVATVLAYYFNKENLDAAAKNVKDVLAVTLPERLRSILVNDKMIPKDKIIHGCLPADKIKFSDVLKELDATKEKRERYPVFDESDKLIKYIMHKSKMVEYLTDMAFAGVSQKDLQNKSLKDVLDDPVYYEKYGKIFESSFATVDESATLMDAKVKMEAVTKCQDIFVTKGGTKDDEVIGWITNVIITENSKVTQQP